MQIFVSIDILYKELTSNEAWKINEGPFEVLFERERECGGREREREREREIINGPFLFQIIVKLVPFHNYPSCEACASEALSRIDSRLFNVLLKVTQTFIIEVDAEAEPS